MEAPLVSIVIPTYNRAHMIRRAVRTCLDQTYPNVEIIIVNDGSADNTAAVCRELAESDLRVRVFSKANSGVVDTLNLGFDHAAGAYLTWTSDDNSYHPDAIEKMVSFLNVHPDVGFVYTDVQDVDVDGNPLCAHEGAEPEALLRHWCLRGCFLYRREVMETIGGYDTRWPRCHDHDYWLRVYRKFRMARLPEVLYDYLVHEDSLSGDHVAHVIEHGELLSSYAASWVEKRSIRAWCAAEIARWEGKRGRRWRAAYHYFRTALYEPSRAGTFWEALWKAGYSCLPDFLKHAWRGLKRRLVRSDDGGV